MYPNFIDLKIGCKVFYKTPLYELDKYGHVILTGEWETNSGIIMFRDKNNNFVKIKTKLGSNVQLSKGLFHRSIIYGIEYPDGSYKKSEWGHWHNNKWVKVSP